MLHLPSKAGRGPAASELGAREVEEEEEEEEEEAYAGPSTQLRPFQEAYPYHHQHELPPQAQQQTVQQGNGSHAYLLQRLYEAQRTAVQESQQQPGQRQGYQQQPAAGAPAGSLLSLYEALQQDPSDACESQHRHQPQHHYHQQPGSKQQQPSRLSANSSDNVRAMPFCSAAGPAPTLAAAAAAAAAAPLAAARPQGQALEQPPHISMLQGRGGPSYQSPLPAAAARLQSPHPSSPASPWQQLQQQGVRAALLLQPCRGPTAAEYEAQWVAIGPEARAAAEGRIAKAHCRVRRGRSALPACLPA
jgi:hypothetical protein